MTKRTSHDSELYRLIEEVILEFLEKGEPTTDEVCNAVIERHKDVVHKYATKLAFSHIHTIVSDKMKKLLATKRGHALQLRLDMRFGGLEPESAYTFRDDSGKIRYVATVRATEEHHRRYIALLREQIEADTARLKVAEWFYAWLKPIFDEHPGITTAEAIVLRMAKGQAA